MDKENSHESKNLQLTRTDFTHTYTRTYFAGIVVATAECVVLQKLCQELSLIKKIKTLNSITEYRYICNQTNNAIIVRKFRKAPKQSVTGAKGLRGSM